PQRTPIAALPALLPVPSKNTPIRIATGVLGSGLDSGACSMIAGWANPTDATAALAASPAFLRECGPARLGMAGRQTLGITWSQAFSQSLFPFISRHPSSGLFSAPLLPAC